MADTGNHLIRKVTPDGFVSTVAGGGSSKTDGFALGVALTAPTGLVMTPEGDLYFTETTRVRKLSPDGRITTAPGISLTEGKGIGFDSKNRLLVADARAKKIYRDTESFSFPEALETPTGRVAERDGSILVSDSTNHRIFRSVPSAETPVTALPVEPRLGSFRTIHPGTMQFGPVAPGQLVYLDWDGTPPSGTLDVEFGSEHGRILGVDGSRIAAIVPRSAALGSTEVSVSDSGSKRAVGSAEIRRSLRLSSAPSRMKAAFAMTSSIPLRAAAS